MHLTDQRVRALPHPETGQKDYADDAIPGLCVRVGKTAKTFRLVIGTGVNRKRFALGRYEPPRFTLAMARGKARDLIAKERLNPSEGSRITFSEAYEIYDRIKLSALRIASARNVRRALAQRFAPKLGNRSLIDIKRTDIAPILDTMLGTPAAMASNFRYLRAFLNWCVARGYIEHAPTSRMKAPRAVESRSRVLSPDELVAIWNSAPDTDYGRILKLCVLSGQRRGQWAEVRREYILGDLITWPSHVMKAGKTHALPLTPRMKALLPERIGYLFPNASGAPFDNWTRNKDRLEASRVQGWRLHDLRRTWATIAADELDIQPHVIESVLAHSVGTSVARTYNRAKYVEPMKKALLAFDEWLDNEASKLEDTNERRQLR